MNDCRGAIGYPDEGDGTGCVDGTRVVDTAIGCGLSGGPVHRDITAYARDFGRRDRTKRVVDARATVYRVSSSTDIDVAAVSVKGC